MSIANNAIIYENTIKAMKNEYKKITAMMETDMEYATANYNNEEISTEEFDKNCMNPIDFAFMSGRACELEKFLKLCNAI